MDKMMLSPAETVDAYVTASKAKVNTPFLKLIVKAIFAGMMIALGAAGSQVASHAIPNVGIARFIAGAIFPMGLMMVVMTGAELFTGDCLMGIAAVKKEIKILSMIRVLAFVYLGNFIGSLFVAVLVYFCGQLNYSDSLLGAFTIKTAAAKCNVGFLKGITSGVLCNVLVCAAVLLAMSCKEVPGKLLSCFFIILLFVVSGYEHCVANMYYIPAGLLCKLNPTYVQVAKESYGLKDLSALNIGTMLLKNLLPVTIGNILGGMFVLGIPLSFAQSSKK